MIAALSLPVSAVVELDGVTLDAIESACERIAPTWPLDSAIAVNPMWGFIEQPAHDVATRLAALTGARLLMARGYYRAKLEDGTIRAAHLTRAAALLGLPIARADVEAWARGSDGATPAPRALVVDAVDARRDLSQAMSWRSFVQERIGAFTGWWLDEHRSFADGATLYEDWLGDARADRSPALLMGARDYVAAARALPHDAPTLFSVALNELGVDPDEREPYLTSLLLDVNGWASVLAYRRATGGEAEGPRFDGLAQLLAVRLAWELLLFRLSDRGTRADWSLAMARWPRLEEAVRPHVEPGFVAQRAHELSYADSLAAGLARGARRRAEEAEPPALQAVFCIDVRSEVFRRALEDCTDEVQTFGFAGFFGLPAVFRAAVSETARAQLPGPLTPQVVIAETGRSGADVSRERGRRSFAEMVHALKDSAVSGFGFVETLGWGYGAASLARTSLPPPALDDEPIPGEAIARPRVVSRVDGGEVTVDQRVEMAAAILRGMSLTDGFAPVVLLVGHVAETRNNPHAAALACGACCGGSGEVNARAVAALLNEPVVRQGLAKHGIRVPAETCFVAALHNTTTDEVGLFADDVEREIDAEVIASTRTWLRRAGERARVERARRLVPEPVTGLSVARELKRRARDWSEVRPEWGLAGNAAFIAAPRERSRHLDLEGRCFLHTYRWREDDDFSVLETILTAPLVVAHWINYAYYSSTVDNERYGAGNKVLHNVVGGNIGVLEGNGGDLRIGLPRQSLHDGERWMHTPLALAAFIEAPRHAIDAVLVGHAEVRALVDNGWVHLHQLDDESGAVHVRARGEWTPLPLSSRVVE